MIAPGPQRAPGPGGSPAAGPHPDRARVTGVLLAAGAGTRYGGPKVLAEGGAWLAAGVDALARGGCDVVHVALGAADAALPPPARPLRVPDWARGMSATLAGALEAAEADGADVLVLHLVDLPDVTAAVTARVLGEAVASGDAAGALARAAYRGRPGHPVVLGRAHWAGLRATLTGDEGGRRYLAARGVRLVECGDLATGSDIDETG